MSEGVIAYKRSRFSTRLPEGRRYMGSHFWLLEEEASVWRVGFTKFAARMLGDQRSCGDPFDVRWLPQRAKFGGVDRGGKFLVQVREALKRERGQAGAPRRAVPRSVG